MNACVIFGAAPGATVPKDFSPDGALLICADGGFALARSLGITPDIVIGDFDSLREIPRGSWETIVLPREKDDTDLLAAVKLALDRGCDDFLILGALGGRLDHSLGNLAVLRFLAEHGAAGVLTDEKTQVFLKRAGDPPLLLENQKGKTLSVFPFGTETCTVTYEGMQYPMEHGQLRSSVPLGVSNVIAEDRAEVLVEQGTAVILLLELSESAK